jgi:hypothetical protein
MKYTKWELYVIASLFTVLFLALMIFGGIIIELICGK